MKDDFYKDIEHKRASKDIDETKNDPPEDEQNQTMKRSDRHRAKLEKEKEKDRQKQAAKSNADEQKAGPFAGIGQKLSAYFNRENIQKGKVFFAGKFSSYNKRFKDELKVSKSKLAALGSKSKNSKTAGATQEKDERKKGIFPIIIGGALLLPLTIILFVMIISNFWPSGENGTELAGGEENTEETSSDQTDEKVNKELEAEKAEKEKELAEKRENNSESESDSSSDAASDEDLGTGDLAFDYSEEEQSELEDAAKDAIDKKESGEDSGSDSSEEESTEEQTEEETTEEPTEEQTEEQTEEPTEEPTEEQTSEPAQEEEPSEESPSGSSSHVVSPEDNLYRIAIRYYGSGSAENVRKITEANGVSPATLTVGEELVIPE